MRSPVGTSLCAAGALMMSLAGGRYAAGALKADAARAEWEQMQAANAVARARASATVGGVVERPVVGSPVARIVAPTIHLDAIVLEGVGDDELDASPGHVPGSALPGERGNAVISAHRDRHFNHLDALAIGDTLTTDTGTRQTRWVVVSRRVIDRTAPALFRTPDATLTLTTCWPMRYVGPAPERLIITAKPV